MRHLIVGTGRSGTAWITKQLGFFGQRWSHEQVFGLENNYAAERTNPKWDGDSSWLAVPFITDVLQDNVQVHHLVRDPLHTVSSYFLPPATFVPMFADQDEPYTEFAIRHRPSLGRLHSNRLDRIVHFYLLWTDWIFSQLGHRGVYRVEDQAHVLVEDIIGRFPEGMHPVNSRRELDTGLILDLDLRDRLLALRAEWGYGDEE